MARRPPSTCWEAIHVGRHWTLAADGMPSNTFWYPLSLQKSVDIEHRNQLIYFRGACGGFTRYIDITNAEEADAYLLHYTVFHKDERRWGVDILVRQVETAFLEVHTKFVTYVHPNEVRFELKTQGGRTVYRYAHRAYPNGMTITVAMIRTLAKAYFIRIGEFTRSTRLVLTRVCPFNNVCLAANKVLWNPRRVINRDQPNLDDWARCVRARHA
jgi:hypothetical protein